MKRDANWLERIRHGLLVWDRDQLIDWLQWVDSNGIWSDEDMLSNDLDPMSVEEAVDQVMSFVAETMETPEEMITRSTRANPGLNERYKSGAGGL